MSQEDSTIRIRADRDDERDISEIEREGAADIRKEKSSLFILGLLALLFVVLAMVLPTGIFYSENTQMTLSVFIERVQQL